jgi:hypothetical protein
MVIVNIPKSEVFNMKKLIALLLTVLMCLSLCACGKDNGKTDEVGSSIPSTGANGSNSSESSPETTPTSAPRPDFQMSDNVEDFTVTINGLVYPLGCDVDVFLNDSWVPKSGYVLEDDYIIPAGETRGVILYNGSKENMVSVKSYYTGADGSAYADGVVLGIHSEDNSTAEVTLSGGLNLNSDLCLQDVVNVFGNDYTHSEFNGDRYVYRFEGKGLYIFTFVDDQLTYWEIRLYEENL